MSEVSDHLGGILEKLRAAISRVQAIMSDPTASLLSPDTPYNLVQQPSSHNSYNPRVHTLPIVEQFNEYGIHSFELDIHAGDPGFNLLPFVDGDHRPAGDYYVYHFTGDSDSHYQFLSDGLTEIAGLDNTHPITLFVDFKGNPFAAADQSQEIFNQLLRQELGDKLFTPKHFMDRNPGATSLPEAVQNGGWPTLAELEGKVIVVMTGSDDRLLEYAGNVQQSIEQSAFIAPNPNVITSPEWMIDLGDGQVDIGPDQTSFNPHDQAIFYNMPQGEASDAAVVHDAGFVTRVYGYDHLGDSSQSTDANHLGTDSIDPAHNEWHTDQNQEPFETIDPPNPSLDEETGEVF